MAVHGGTAMFYFKFNSSIHIMQLKTSIEQNNSQMSGGQLSFRVDSFANAHLHV